MIDLLPTILFAMGMLLLVRTSPKQRDADLRNKRLKNHK